MRISIHALRGEGDRGKRMDNGEWVEFQSTPSVGRATRRGNYVIQGDNISIHALRGEGDNDDHRRAGKAEISIHALRGEGDLRGGYRERST